MGVIEILLIIACTLFVLGVFIAWLIRKKQGKTSCDCGGDCSQCHGCSHQIKKEDENIEKDNK